MKWWADRFAWIYLYSYESRFFFPSYFILKDIMAVHFQFSCKAKNFGSVKLCCHYVMVFTVVTTYVRGQLLTNLKSCRIIPFDNVIIKDLNLPICYCGKSHNTNWSVLVSIAEGMMLDKELAKDQNLIFKFIFIAYLLRN